MKTDELKFQKSSYSAQHQECVEVARFRKSSHSGQDQDCVEVAGFRKSSYSSDRVECVEVADTAFGAAVRDSKYPGAGHISFPSAEWSAFLSAAQRGRL
ncbi:DUF397 domain-containing protein [Nocardiopsis potens]|uniref:DUF397 domain-containing protein n=1 Tax=Nocardiopsis potens TaxID=1246458 RepID=UPI0003457062|nr:DUF397 domain-containing protein [Nocardiopsis potens]